MIYRVIAKEQSDCGNLKFSVIGYEIASVTLFTRNDEVFLNNVRHLQG